MSEEPCAGVQNEQYKWDDNLEIFPSKSSWEIEVNQSTTKVLATYPRLNEFISLAFYSYVNRKETEFTQHAVGSLKLDISKNLEGKSTMTTKDQRSLQQRTTLLSKFQNGFSKKASRLCSHFSKAGSRTKATPADSSKLGKTPEGFGFVAQAANKSADNGYHGVAFIHREKKQIILSHRGTKLLNSEDQIADFKSCQISSAMTFAHEVSLFAQETGCEVFFTGNSLGGCLAQITCFSVKYLTIDHDTSHFVRKPADQWDNLHPYTVVFNCPGPQPFLQEFTDDLIPRNEAQSQEINVAHLPIVEHQLNSNTKKKRPNNKNIFPSYFLTTKELELLKDHQMKLEEGASYEGTSLEEEEAANNLVQISRGIQLLENGTIELRGSMDKKELIPLVRYIAHKLEDGKIWWNLKEKPELPHNHIQRRVCRTTELWHCRYPSFTPKRKTLLEINEDFILLVGDPGTGRTVAITDLEQSLRKNISSNRIIIRINLSHVKKEILEISDDCALSVLVNLSPFLPLKTLQMEGISIVVLLDGLDEICQRNQVTMINLLRILKPRESNQPQHSHFRVVLTAPRHLRDIIESEFTVESWSLCPITNEDKVNMIQAELGVTRKNSTELNESFVRSGLFENPRMLSMLLDFLKSGGCISAIRDCRTYNFYSRFFELKHEPSLEVRRLKAHVEMQIQSAQQLNAFKLVPISGCGRPTPFAKMRVESMLNRNLPFYFHIAWNQLLRGDSAGDALNISLPPAFTKSIERVALDPSSYCVVEKLLNFGLLDQNRTGQLVFKHRSLADFFSFGFWIVGWRTLFGCIYRSPHVLENVKSFIFTATGYIYPLVSITTNWLLATGNVNQMCELFLNYVEGKLYCPLDHDVFKTFVTGDERDLFIAFRVLVDNRCRDAFYEFFEWILKKRVWNFELLPEISEIGESSQKRYSHSVALLFVAFAIAFKDQQLLSVEEVKTAFGSCDRLISTVAAIQIHTRNKWDFVEEQVGEIQWRKLLEKADHVDFMTIIDDVETLRRLSATVSFEYIFSLVSKVENSVTDVVGWEPLHVLNKFREMFVTQDQVAQIRFNITEGDEEKPVFHLCA